MANCKVTCICHEKGGTGKTTTAVSLGIGLVRQGKKVLLIDADPQGDLSKCLGIANPQELQNTLSTAMNSVIAENPIDPVSVILHHNEAIRQGNSNPEVNIYTYITEKTFDAYSYQLIENKQHFISQIMTSKSPVRSAEDVDEQALSFAEIKALATGNPLIIEKCQLEMDVGKLKLIKSSFLSQRYDLEDKILKYYPAENRRLTERITGYEADIEKIRGLTLHDGYPMVVKDVSFEPDKKKEAGTAILEACKAMTNPDPVSLGQYRGFDMELSFDSFSRAYKVALKGTLTHAVELGDNIFGNITRIDNALEGMEPKLQACREQLEATQTQMETAKVEVEKPFPQEAELNKKSARLNEVNIALNLDERDHELVDAAPDEGDSAEQPERINRDRER